MKNLTETDDLVVYKLKIVDPDGDEILFNGGREIEMDLIAELSRIVSEDTGFFATKASRRKVVASSLNRAFQRLKDRTVEV